MLIEYKIKDEDCGKGEELEAFIIAERIIFVSVDSTKKRITIMMVHNGFKLDFEKKKETIAVYEALKKAITSALKNEATDQILPGIGWIKTY